MSVIFGSKTQSARLLMGVLMCLAMSALGKDKLPEGLAYIRLQPGR